MIRLYKFICVCALIWMIFQTNNKVYADTYIPGSTFKLNSRFDVFVCAADQEREQYWFAILFRRPFSIPLIYPEEQTSIYCYDKNSNTVSEKLISNQRIYSIAPYENGIVFLRDHYFFLDQEICYFDTELRKTTVFKKPRTVGKIIAIHDNFVFYQGSTAYDDRNIYLYNLMTQDIKTFCKDVVTAFADQYQIYVVTNADPIGIDVYDINTNVLLYSVALDSSSDILSISDNKVLTKDGQLFLFECDSLNVSQKTFELNKNLTAGWIEDDHLVIISGDVLESYRLYLPEIEYTFSQDIGENIYSVAMQFNKLFLLDGKEKLVRIICVDDKEDQSTIFFGTK